MDVSGESQIDVDAHLLKQRLDPEGRPVDEAPEKHGIDDMIKMHTFCLKCAIRSDSQQFFPLTY